MDDHDGVPEDHEPADESVVDKVAENIIDSSDSSSDSDDDDDDMDVTSPAAVVKRKIYRLFGRERPVHKVLGGGKPAEIILWRDHKVSAGVLGFATAVWVLFELLEYRLVTLVSHTLIFAVVISFLLSNTSAFVNKARPKIPEIVIPEDIVLSIASALTIEFNGALSILREVALGRDPRKFLAVFTGLWILSMLGHCFNFLTLFYIALVLLHTVPVLYESYEDQVDALAEKAEAELNKKYAVFNAKYLTKIQKRSSKDKKFM